MFLEAMNDSAWLEKQYLKKKNLNGARDPLPRPPLMTKVMKNNHFFSPSLTFITFITCIARITCNLCITWITFITCIECITCITSISRITCIIVLLVLHILRFLCNTCITCFTSFTYIICISCITCITWFTENLKKKNTYHIITDCLTHSLTDKLKSRDASASKKMFRIISDLVSTKFDLKPLKILMIKSVRPIYRVSKKE